MGFDLTGCQPKNQKGEYFRNNVWWWRPLWTYCLDEKLITQEDYQRGQFNDGHHINNEQAIRIGIKLKHLIGQGKTLEYKNDYEKHLKSLPDRTCKICKGTGKRTDVVVKNGCNACEGTGKQEAWEKSYPFDVDNVKEFAEFCINSGGFQIY